MGRAPGGHRARAQGGAAGRGCSWPGWGSLANSSLGPCRAGARGLGRLGRLQTISTPGPAPLRDARGTKTQVFEVAWSSCDSASAVYNWTYSDRATPQTVTAGPAQVQCVQLGTPGSPLLGPPISPLLESQGQWGSHSDSFRRFLCAKRHLLLSLHLLHLRVRDTHPL